MIRYITGDATRPVGPGTKIIAHVCNDIGAWGAGFVVALSQRWAMPEQMYRAAFKGEGNKPALGRIQIIPIPRAYSLDQTGEVFVANMIAQDGVGWRNGKPPIRYWALNKCLHALAHVAQTKSARPGSRDEIASVHMPRIGCGLAGGKWEKVESLIESNLCRKGIQVMVYDLPPRRVAA